jgi:hypothetical protein
MTNKTTFRTPGSPGNGIGLPLEKTQKAEVVLTTPRGANTHYWVE